MQANKMQYSQKNKPINVRLKKSIHLQAFRLKQTVYICIRKNVVITKPLCSSICRIWQKPQISITDLQSITLRVDYPYSETAPSSIFISGDYQ